MASESTAMTGLQAISQRFLPESYRVAKAYRESSDAVTLAIEPTAGSTMTFLPGQFNMLYVHGIGEVPVSISGEVRARAGGPLLLLHTIRNVGAVSQALCRLKVGEPLGVRGPFGTGWPVERAVGKSVMFLAGGIGLAPLRPAIRQVLGEIERHDQVAVFYGARTPEDLIFQKETLEWQRRGCSVGVTVDRASEGWGGNIGVVTGLLPKTLAKPADWVALLCGPEIMMRHAVTDLLALGLGAAQIFVSLERNMKCAVGLCGHCQFNKYFMCRQGAVFCYQDVEQLLRIKEL